MIAKPHPNQAGRLEALHRYKILDTPKEALYDDIAFLAAQICDAPIAVINFIDECRQWFKAEIGLGVRQTPLDTSICSHAILEDDFLLIPDTLLDQRFANNPLCVSEPHLRFYAGALLKTREGLPLGTVCVLDTKPRRLSEDQKGSLLRLARQVMILLELRVSVEDARHSEELALSAMESNPDCVKVLDLEGRILSMNRNGCRVMEVDDLSTIANLPWPELWRGAEREKAVNALKSAREGNQARFSGYCKTAKGKDKYWDVMVSPIKDTDGLPRRILSIARDMTVRREEEAQFRETAKLESLGVLAGGIAHDFNNLLTGILGNASLLAEVSASPDDRHLAREVVSAAEHAADLTRQMLAYSGKGRFLVERMNLSAVVLNILRLIQTTIDKKVELVLKLDESLPPVDADPAQMQQLIMNLIINASEAMQARPGRVAISTAAIDVDADFIAQTFRSNEPSLSAGRYVRIEVHDTGSGMSEETLGRVFDPFFTTKFTGRGLGLAAVSGILRGHRGAVRVYSHVGQGTTFQVFLPVAQEYALQSADLIAESPPSAHLGWGTVLLADDEETVRRVGLAAMQRLGYEVLLAEDGKQAVELFTEHHRKTRLIILDLTMPVMSGEESLDLLRKVDPQIPIVLSSGYNQVEIIRRFTKQNITGFLEKPYTVTQLREAIAKALPESAPAAEA